MGGVQIGRQAEASRADRSFYMAGVGRLSLAKCAVTGPQDLGGSFHWGLSPPARGETWGEKRRPSWPPGSDRPYIILCYFLYKFSLYLGISLKIFSRQTSLKKDFTPSYLVGVTAENMENSACLS